MSRSHTFNGRTYTVLAHYEGDDADAQAREYLRTHLHVKMLFSVPGEAMVVHDRDFGKPVDAPDSEFGTKGWKSLFD